VIGPDDALIVAPYNNQVGLIRRLLPDGARVETVDKFQGQEAPVVLYQMTSTSAEGAPRGASFLYNLHRLNVAVSRAKALAVVVMSEKLLDAAVRAPEQLRQFNALCRLGEMATAVAP
jgi:superfamily I DNA and/or RNA helicase